ncbi:hypothetical protein [Deinococcus grandis]|nr:hypothetical protein [Deinococcus grandis]
MSRKSLMLLTYLTLSGQAQHRAAVARLLWPQAHGLQNLRVDLTMLRRQGIEVAPPKAPLLHAVLPTDLDVWEADLHAPLEEWLARAHAPLDGLDDPTLPEWTAWLAGQREALLGRVRAALTRRLTRESPDAARAALVLAAAARLGVTLDAPPHGLGAPGPVAALPDRAARDPQVLMQVGRPGSGRFPAVRAALDAAGWTAVTVTGTPSSAHLLAGLVLQVRSHLPAAAQADADSLLRGASDPEQDVVRLSPLLLRLACPVAFVVRRAECLDEAGVRLLAFLLGTSAPVTVALITAPHAEADLRRQLERLGAGPRLLVQRSLPPAPDAFGPLLPGGAPAGAALEVWRQSEGWWPAARAIARQVGAWNRRVRLPADLRETLLAEVHAAVGPDLAAHLSRLAGLPSPFALDAAAAALGEAGVGGLDGRTLARRTARAAVRAGLLEPVPERVVATLPGLPVTRAADRALPLAFRSELHRAALAGQLSAAERLHLRSLPGASDVWARPDDQPHDQPRGPRGAPEARGGQDRPALSRPADASALAAPDETGASDVPGSVYLGGGYHLLRAAGQISVVRLGDPHGPAPTLHLRLPGPGAPGLHRWSLSVHVRADGAPDAVTLLAPTPGTPVPGRFRCLPDAWTDLSGLSDGPGLELVCGARNLTLTVTDVSYHPALALCAEDESA